MIGKLSTTLMTISLDDIQRLKIRPSIRLLVKILAALVLSVPNFLSVVVAQPIVGIGDLKIGMSEQKFLDLPYIKGKKIQDAGRRSSLDLIDGDIWRQTSDSDVPEYLVRLLGPELSIRNKIYSPHHSKYEFKLRTGVKNKSGTDEYDAVTEFYKKELIDISLTIGSSSSAFIDILTTKYGEPYQVNKMTKESCQNESSVSTEHDTGVVAFKWGENAPIEASVVNVRMNCGKNLGSYYSVHNRAAVTLVTTLLAKGASEAITKFKQSKAAASKL
jgi:hypothetical protein